MSEDRGSVTLWILGLVLMILALGGLSLDLWRGIAVRRGVAAVADAAAVAGANGIDEEAYRTGTLRLDPTRAEALAVRAIRSEPHSEDLRWDLWVSADRITVRIETGVDLTLLRILSPGGEPLRIRVSSTASARRGG